MCILLKMATIQERGGSEGKIIKKLQQLELMLYK